VDVPLTAVMQGALDRPAYASPGAAPARAPELPGQERAADAVEDLEIALLLEAVHQRHGYDFRGYALSAMRRRIRRRLRDEEVRTVSGLQEKVLHDGRAMERLVENLSVTTTSMFRDPSFFRALRTHVVPVLRTYPVVRIWHAGCSTGEEVYSLAILLMEENLYERSRVYATDLQPRLLQRAATGLFELEAVRRWDGAYQAAGGAHRLARYYEPDGRQAVMAPELRRNVMFAQHNLVTDASFNEFHLILCRNVLMYFTPPLQLRAQRLVHDSLAVFGYLGLGHREALCGPLEPLYAPASRREKLYRRVA
jgi:chemotaxis protein methyltransferase CheR